jgi:hemoglobin/transferrin/lactoferrin receptor protein
MQASRCSLTPSGSRQPARTAKSSGKGHGIIMAMIETSGSMRRAFTVTASLVAMTAAAAAQSPAPTTPLDDITISATRNPVRAHEFPGMVTPVQREEIEKSAPTNPRDVFFSVPGVSFGGGARRTGQFPTIRGFGGSDIVVTIDGARQDWVTAHDGRFFIDPQFLKRVDVVRGPTSSVYGSGGLGGAIAFETLDPSDILAPGHRFGVRSTVGGQSANRELSVGQAVAIRPIEHFSMLAYFVGRNSGDIRLGDGTDLRAKDSVRSGLVKAVYDDGEFKWRASWLRFGNRPIEPGNPQTGNPAANSATGLILRDVSTDQLSFDARYAPKSNQLIDVGLRIYNVETKNNEKEFTARPVFSRTLTTTGFTLDNRSRFMLAPGISGLVTVGVEGTLNKAETSNLQGPGQNNGTPSGKTSLFGAFAQGDFTITNLGGLPGRLLISPGVRFDTFESENANNRTNKAQAISPRLGITYAPVEWGFVFANVGKAFRAPTLTELYADGIHFRLGPQIANRFVPNPDLRPQTGVTYEAGFGLRFNDLLLAADTFRFKASVYQTEVSNLIDARVRQPTPPGFCFAPGFNPACIPFNGTTTVQNVGKATFRGWEMEGRYDAGLFYIGANASYVEGQDQASGASVGAQTPLKFRADGGVRFLDGQLTLGARATFADVFNRTTFANSPIIDPAARRGGYTTWDIYATITPRGLGLDGLRIDLGVDNVFDRQYQVVFSGVKEWGRNYKGLVSYTKSW